MWMALLLALAVIGAPGCGGTSARSGLPALDYTKTGGIGGVREHLTVAADGVANLDGYAFTLDAAERADLARAVKGVDFAGNAGHGRGDAHPDAFVYALLVDGRPVLAGDYVIPSAVAPVTAALDRIAAAHSPARRRLEAEAKRYLVLMVRDGGVAGEHVELRLARDGRAIVTFQGQRTTTTAPAEALAAARRALAGDPEDLRSPQDPEIVVADGFSYLVITGDTTIEAGDPVKNPQLQRLLAALEQIVEAARPIP